MLTSRHHKQSSQSTLARARSPSPTSPKTFAGHARRPSITVPKPNPMTAWLGRTSSSQSRDSFGQTPKPILISDPQATNYNALDITVVPRRGKLGTGATVVRTPEEALREDPTEDGFIAPAKALPLPPLEFESVPVSSLPYSKSSPSLPLRDIQDPKPVPMGPPPPLPTARLRPVLKTRGSSPTTSGEFCPPLPPMSMHLAPPPPQPAFDALLLSPSPPRDTDPAKTIVTLETSTQTFRATLATLTSHESHLATYLHDLLNAEDRPREEYIDDAASVYSEMTESESALDSIFKRHLTATGVLPPEPPKPRVTTIHLFLDRPSAPYAHILAYLRTPSTAESPAGLPRGAQLSPWTPERAEALLDLRDEAKYLGIAGLHKLCTDALAPRYAPTHKRGPSSASTTSTLNNEHSTPSIQTVLNSPSTRLGRLGKEDSSSPVSTGPPPSALALRSRSRSQDGTQTVHQRPTGAWI